MRPEQIEQISMAPELADTHHLPQAAIRAYTIPSKQCITDDQINELLPMVTRIAQQTITYLPGSLSFEDVIAAGTLGLVKAAKNFNPTHNTEFKTYAFIRIRGAILDELKKWNFIPSSMSKKIGEAFNVAQQLTAETGFPPTDEQLAIALGISIDEVDRIYHDSRIHQFMSLDIQDNDNNSFANILKASTDAPDGQMNKQELIDKLTESIQSLPERKRQLMLLYYHQELTMKEIAEVFEITESRVSQLHAAALFELSVKLKDFKNARDKQDQAY
ncbi:MAG: FliA/WhiG family RNA polymerase sigma factor [Anaerohalosphaera sp.]|nr:FliA/WhiG family RNA polymerase sigma factor [Anaerohalosphaera sp.]